MSALRDVFKGIADSIRSVDNTTELIALEQFANRIRDLPLVTIKVEVEDGATVTATQGDTVVSAASVGGVATLTLQQTGDWVIRSSKKEL